jgi:hypothetical protein
MELVLQLLQAAKPHKLGITIHIILAMQQVHILLELWMF